jgi:hypothetical protein
MERSFSYSDFDFSTTPLATTPGINEGSGRVRQAFRRSPSKNSIDIQLWFHIMQRRAAF